MLNKLRLPIIVLFWTLLRVYFPERSLDDTGPYALWDSLFALGLTGLVILTTLSIGVGLLRQFRVNLDSLGETYAVAWGLGMAVLSSGIFGLGIAGYFRASTLWAWLFLLSMLAGRDANSVSRTIRARLKLWRFKIQGLPIGNKVVLVLFILLGLISLSNALAPPSGYDGLMYHLYGPREYLAAGRIVLLESPVQTNYPFGLQMIFGLGLSYGSAAFARLIHWCFALGLVGLAYLAARRFADADQAWISAAVLLTTPIVHFWAQIANVDAAWAYYEFAAVYLALMWMQKRHPVLLVMAGAMSGIAIGIKYQAILGAFVLGVWILWQSRAQGWRLLVRHSMIFGTLALTIPAPWFAKNWLSTGNPIFPFVFGGPGWNASQLDHLQAAVGGFGTGFSFPDYLLLPFNLYFKNELFSTLSGIEIPSVLFLLIFLYPWSKPKPVMSALVVITTLRFLAWSVAQHARYLLPLFPALSVISAYVFFQLVRRVRLGRFLVYTLVTSLMLVALGFQLFMAMLLPPWPVVIGTESKSDYLYRAVNQYAAIRFVTEELPEEAKVMMLWDGRAFYCDERCLPDRAQQSWPMLVLAHGTVEAQAKALHTIGITHLFYSKSDHQFFMELDKSGLHHDAGQILLDEFVPACAEMLFDDRNVSVYELTCP